MQAEARPGGTTRRRKRFLRNEAGVTAIEFGIVAMPFVALMLVTLQTSLNFFASQILETAVSDTSRLIMTGQAQSAKMTAADFKGQVCQRLPSLFDCTASVQVDVRTYKSFGSADAAKPVVNGALNWSPQYNPGVGGDIVVVRAVFQLKNYANFFGNENSSLKDGTQLLMATAAFRNEPFS